MKYGLEETRDLIDFLIAGVSCWENVYDDKTIDITDIPDFWEVLLKIGPLIAQSELIPKELADIQENLDVTGQTAELLMDKLFIALHAVYEVYMLIKQPSEEATDADS